MFGNEKKVPTTGSAPTYVGKGMQIKGKIWGVRPIWIEGEVQGSIDCATEVIIGEAGKVDAAIRASTIKVNGFVEGELIASTRIEVMAKGRVHGDIKSLAGCLIIHDGGILEGQCSTATEEKMKNLLPQQFPKLLPEETDQPVKEIQAPEKKEDSESLQTEENSESTNNTNHL